MEDSIELVAAATAATGGAAEPEEEELLTTGEYFTAILLAVIPSAFGKALGAIGAKQGDPTAAEWAAALKNQGDTDAVNAELLKILTSSKYKQIINALRKPQHLRNKDRSPVTYNDNTEVVLDHAGAVRDLVWNNNGMLSSPWTSPPHPKGQDLLALIKLLSGYK